MIRKQYEEWPGPAGVCYFNNFLDSTRSDAEAAVILKKYNAKFGKTKRRTRLNVKWYDPKLYTLFVLRWSK